jgi:hypothetical protein
MESYGPMNCGPMGQDEGLKVLIFALVVLVIAIPVLIVKIIGWWKICTKAGFSGWLALLMLIPLADIIMPLVVGFMGWPILRELQTLKHPVQQSPHTQD